MHARCSTGQPVIDDDFGPGVAPCAADAVGVRRTTRSRLNRAEATRSLDVRLASLLPLARLLGHQAARQHWNRSRGLGFAAGGIVLPLAIFTLAAIVAALFIHLAGEAAP